MKNELRIIALVVFGLLVLSSFNQADALSTWHQTYGAASNDANSVPIALIQTSNGGYVFAIYRGIQTWVSKLDAEGGTIWEKNLGDSFNGNQIAQAPDGGYVLLGTQSLVKLDPEGNILWNQTYEDKNSQVDLCSLCPTNEGGFVLGGTINGYTGQSSQSGNTVTTYENPDQVCLIKVDSAGNVEWNQTFAIEYMPTQITSVVQTSDGGYALVGKSGGQFSDTFSSIYFAKTDDLGNVLWDKIFGVANFGEYPSSMIQTSDGGYAIAGVMENNSSMSTAGLIKLDSSGNIQWQQLYSDGSYSGITSMIQAESGGYVFAGINFYDSPDGTSSSSFW